MISNRVSTLTRGSQMDHTVIFHIDGPVLIANSENLNQVSRSGSRFALWWGKKYKLHLPKDSRVFRDQL